jgi:DNA invertase Pin-like site-specific DNA recombinase
MLNGKTLSGCLCLQAEGELEEGGMLSMLKRHEVEILLKAGHGKAEVARLAGVSLCSVKRIAQEGPVVHVDDYGNEPSDRSAGPARW